jgi:hypothetical protein
MRERLVKELTLSGEQQRKLDEIFQQSREEFRALQGVPEQERGARAQQIREATRARLRGILTPDQQARYDVIASPTGGRAARVGIAGRVWVLGPDGKLAPVSVTLGISDGAATEVLQGDLKERQEVVVGSTGPAGGPGTRPPSGPRLRL